MKILVCISHVPDTTSKINFTDDNTAFDKSGVSFVINPYDEFGLTRAINLREEKGGSVTVLNVGKSDTEPTLRKALAIGADDAIRVDAEPEDAWFVSRQIASVIENGEYDLVIVGRESIDYNGGQVPGMVAAMLKWPFVNACVGLEAEDGKAVLTREIDGGREKLSAKFPLLIGGQKGLVEEKDLRIPNMRGIMMAKKKKLEVREAVEADAKTKAVKYAKPDPKGDCKMIDADNVEELVELLHNKAKVI